MFINPNCIHFEGSGYRCRHKDRPKWLFLFESTCIEPNKLCTLKEIHKKPKASPPPPRKRCRQEGANIKMDYHKRTLEILESLAKAGRAFWNGKAGDDAVEDYFETELVRAEDFLEEVGGKPRHHK